MRKFILVAAVALSVSSGAAYCQEAPSPVAASQPQEPQLEVNNNWGVAGGLDSYDMQHEQNIIWIILKKDGTHWDIDQIARGPVHMSKTDDRELLKATPDLQHWGGGYRGMINNCDSFEMRELQEKSICTSQFTEKKTARAAVTSLFFHGDGKVGVDYDRSRVAAAIHSIRPDQAEQVLDDFEKSNQ